MGLYGGSVNSFMNFAQLPVTLAEEQNNIEIKLNYFRKNYFEIPVEEFKELLIE